MVKVQILDGLKIDVKRIKGCVLNHSGCFGINIIEGAIIGAQDNRQGYKASQKKLNVVRLCKGVDTWSLDKNVQGGILGHKKNVTSIGGNDIAGLGL